MFSVLSAPHYLILDTNIVLEQIDLVESEGLQNVVILQTVLQEVKHRSSPIYKRLRDIVSDKKRNFYVFVNEHRKETYIEREEGESANDRNDRGKYKISRLTSNVVFVFVQQFVLPANGTRNT